jgi:hypothetical protein
MKKLLIILFFKINFLSSSLVDLLQPIHREGVVVVARVPVQGIPAVPTRRNLQYMVWSLVAVTLKTFECMKEKRRRRITVTSYLNEGPISCHKPPLAYLSHASNGGGTTCSKPPVALPVPNPPVALPVSSLQ